MRSREQLGTVSRTAIFLATLTLLTALASGAIAIGSEATPKQPAPSGSASNGSIAYAAQGDIWLASVDGETARVTSGPGLKRDPAWAPDGTAIAYSSLQGDEYELVVIDADGAGARVVASGLPSDPGWVRWKPDGTAIAFESIDESLVTDDCGDVFSGVCGSRIWVATADGSSLAQIGPTDLDAANPAWSPDGSTLAFAARVQDEAGEAVGLFLMDADGSSVRRLGDVSGPPGRALYWNSWSPDGTRIATQTIPNVVYVIDVETGAATEVASGPLARFVAWSPDGSELAVSGWMVGGAIIGRDGTERLIDAMPVGYLHWSPDGTMLVGATEYSPDGIHLLSPEGDLLTTIETPGRGTGSIDFQPLAP